MCRTSNSTDVKVTIKRRADGVYDIYKNDEWAAQQGNVSSACKVAEELLQENFENS